MKMNKKIKIDWGDWVVLIVCLCATISILSNNLYIKIIFLFVELIIALISSIIIKIITRKENKKFEREMEELKNKIEGELKNVGN